MGRIDRANAVADEPPGPENVRRSGADRRRRPTGPWDALRPGGRRAASRRVDDARGPFFVDRFPPRQRWQVVLLLICSLADATATLYLLGVGGQEANPAMGLLLRQGPRAFLVGKHLLTSAGLPVLLIFQHWPLFGSRLRVRHVLPALIALYAILLLYQLSLLSMAR
jgi:hypothetical protein